MTFWQGFIIAAVLSVAYSATQPRDNYIGIGDEIVQFFEARGYTTEEKMNFLSKLKRQEKPVR